MTDSVLHRIYSVVEEAGRQLVEGQVNGSLVQQLTECQTNLDRIKDFLSADVRQSISEAVDELLLLVVESRNRSTEPIVDPAIVLDTEHEGIDSVAKAIYTSLLFDL